MFLSLFTRVFGFKPKNNLMSPRMVLHVTVYFGELNMFFTVLFKRAFYHF